MNFRRLLTAVATGLFLFSLSVQAQDEPQPAIITNDGIGFSRVADGEVIAYDLVEAYDNHSITVADCTAHQVTLKGATWCFASADNAATFRAATEGEDNHYLPFGGGHCSLGLAFDNLAARGDPRTAVRVGDLLVLNGNFDVRARFLSDTEQNVGNALTNYANGLESGALVQ